MNQILREHIKCYCKSNGWSCETDKDIIETVTESPSVHKEITTGHRWYDDTWEVRSVGGVLVGFEGYHITGDKSMSDMGLEYDVNTFVQVQEMEMVVKKYVPMET